ncbi:hypothetical protein M422DRAFT_135873, partial [Sphaerobolus stellatus SS14]
IIEYLTDNPDFRRKLFSDSTRDAKASGRKKSQGKDGKTQMFLVLADEVFGKSQDLTLVSQYDKNPNKYGKSVGQHLARLKRTYVAHVKGLGKTGAGLDSKDVTAGSEIVNKIDLIRQEFPFWDDLHAFWRELPNYNPIAISNSKAGTERDVEA